MKLSQRASVENLHEWAMEAERDLDGLNALRLRKAAGCISELQKQLAASRDRESKLMLRIDELKLNRIIAHRVQAIIEAGS